jgi:hypothetical protein
MKLILALVIGCAGGYYLGYEDGIAGDPSIMSRVVGKVGGRARGSVSNDVDAQMKAAEDTSKTKQALDKRDKILPK